MSRSHFGAEAARDMQQRRRMLCTVLLLAVLWTLLVWTVSQPRARAADEVLPSLPAAIPRGAASGGQRVSGVYIGEQVVIYHTLPAMCDVRVSPTGTLQLPRHLLLHRASADSRRSRATAASASVRDRVDARCFWTWEGTMALASQSSWTI